MAILRMLHQQVNFTLCKPFVKRAVQSLLGYKSLSSSPLQPRPHHPFYSPSDQWLFHDAEQCTAFDVQELQNVAGLSMHSGALTFLKLRKAATTKYSSSNLKTTHKPSLGSHPPSSAMSSFLLPIDTHRPVSGTG